MASAPGYYNDKQKLADALALARSFSRAKATKGRSAKESIPSQCFTPQSKLPPPTRQLRSSAKQQSAQSLTRALDSTTISHRQAVKRHQRMNSLYNSQFAPTARPMGGWQVQKELPSITGGRGLDFLSRKDAEDVAQPVQSIATEMIEPPRTTLPLQQQQPGTGGDGSAEAPRSSVLDTFYALMSEHEKEMQQVNPLVDKMRQWNLQSPTLAKAKPIAATTQAPPPPAQFAPNMTIIPDTKIIADQVNWIGEKNKENLPVLLSSAINDAKLETRKIEKVEVKLPTAPESILFPTPPKITAKQEGEAKVFRFPELAATPAGLPPLSKLAVNTETPIKPTPPRAEVFQAPVPVVTMPKMPVPVVEELKMSRPLTSKTPAPIKCTCIPDVKPQRGLSSSRFASKESTTSLFANNFPVSLQVMIHKDFCPLYNKKSNQEKGHVRDASRSQKKLRAEADPFTPSLVKSPIIDQGF